MRGLLLVALAALTWGTTGSVSALLVERAAGTPLLIGAMRMILGALTLLVAAWASRQGRIDPADRLRCLAMGIALAVFQIGYFGAVPLVGVALTALIAICSAPVMIALLAWIALGERPTARVGVALVLGIAGTALLIAGPRAAADVSPRLVGGAGLAAMAALAYATFVVLAKTGLARSAPWPLTGASFAIAAVLLSPALVWGDAPFRQIAMGWPWYLYLGVVTTGVAYALYTNGLRRVSAAAAGVVSLVEPLSATLIGVLLLGERLGAAGITGAMLLLGAMVLLLRSPEPTTPATPPG